MPKLKTNRGAAKRFKVRKSGRVKAKHSNMRHMLHFSKTPKQKRHLRGTFELAPQDAKKVKRELLPYG
ncbi:MAG: 50S ribosomal protein L35 [Deltaproteobacteria bacterium]|nr:MAG: 50S ribosomal protein L35 [Deltaproteobacteria bacterium]